MKPENAFTITVDTESMNMKLGTLEQPIIQLRPHNHNFKNIFLTPYILIGQSHTQHLSNFNKFPQLLKIADNFKNKNVRKTIICVKESNR